MLCNRILKRCAHMLQRVRRFAIRHLPVSLFLYGAIGRKCDMPRITNTLNAFQQRVITHEMAIADKAAPAARIGNIAERFGIRRPERAIAIEALQPQKISDDVQGLGIRAPDSCSENTVSSAQCRHQRGAGGGPGLMQQGQAGNDGAIRAKR
jgi:hypothetical protein